MGVKVALRDLNGGGFSPDKKNFEILPHLFTEYQNRWYVVGETDKGFRVFGLDRIASLKVLNNKPFKNKTEEANEKLIHTVGLNFSDY